MFRLLIIEDDRSIQKLFVRHFEKAGFSVTAVHSGEQALQAARAGVDFAVVDLGLPGMSGIAVIEALRADPPTAGIGIIVVSARSGVQDHALALESGADGFLAKPVKPKELEEEIRRVRAAREQA